MAKVDKQLHRRFTELLQSDPSFQVVLDDERTWVCPYCGAPAVADRKAPTFENLALQHLLDKCPRAKGLQGNPMPPAQLQEVVVFDRLKKRFMSEPAWRMKLGNGTWLCPYCIQPTKARIVNEKGQPFPVEMVVREIHNHLEACYDYHRTPDRWHSVDELQSTLRQRKQQDAAAQAIADKVKSDAVFRFSDQYGHWICPFCEKPITDIDFSTSFAQTYTAPRQILAHFESGFCKFKGGTLSTPKTVDAMKQIAGRFVGAPKQEAQNTPPPPTETQYIELLRSELGELKHQIDRSKELQQNLQRARQAQHKMLPSEPPKLDGYEIEAFFRASDEVSGDFYDFVPLPDGRVGILVGDVSGHGFDAGLVMGMAKKAFSVRAQSGEDPVAVASRVNSDILPELDKTTFVTAVYGILDPHNHTFQFIRCGHTFPVMYVAARNEAAEVQSEGMVLGSLVDQQFTAKAQLASVQMGPGDCLALFTDGVIEAMAEDGREFSAEQTRETVLRHGASSARGVLEGLLGSIFLFTAGFRQSDDQTVLVIKRRAG